jgi:putative aminopeptidase FrvX
MDLLKQLCNIQAPSGEEYRVKDFLLQYIEEHKAQWYVQPEICYGDEFQDSLLLIFGRPRTAIYAHMDNIGYTVKYNGEIIRIGGSKKESNIVLVGHDSQGDIECLSYMEESEESTLQYKASREIDRGTSLSYKMSFRETGKYVTSCYLDNRLGIYAALHVAQTLENGAIAFTCNEEHGGGNAQKLARYLWEKHRVNQALIADITWITEGVEHGKGVAISMRDSSIPRRLYLNKIIEIARRSGIPYQLEVEASGGSDGAMIQKSDVPVDWCFVGAAEENVHSPDETVHKDDIASMIALYKELMEKL